MPTRYLLDTNICIYIQRQKPGDRYHPLNGRSPIKGRVKVGNNGKDDIHIVLWDGKTFSNGIAFSIQKIIPLIFNNIFYQIIL
jgi:hypothetical protein